MSESTNVFETWLEANDPEGYDEIYSLHMAVDRREDWGPWKVTIKDDKTFVNSPFSTLQLLSEKARQAFLAEVDALRGTDNELDIESWYHYHRNIDNPHA
jgi:hypothetical protein